MIKIGENQTLKIARKVDFGVYLTEGEQEVLLPKKYLPENYDTGMELEVFVYKDSQDRIIATTQKPLITLGGIAFLPVKEKTKIGAFLDWGLEKDLLLPFKEQTGEFNVGDRIPVALYLDKSSRLCGTMKIYKFLTEVSDYKKDDRVEGYIYEISRNFGAFVVVDGKYSGLIPPKEMVRPLKVGETVNCRITGIREDGKLNMSIREKVQFQMSIDSARIVEALKQQGGALPFTDKASPELIKEKMCMSKNEFKRAIGNLLKEGIITIEKDRIVLNESREEKP